MTEDSKLNQLLLNLPKGALVLSSWLESEGYSYEQNKTVGRPKYDIEGIKEWKKCDCRSSSISLPIKPS